jgi:hypothetical protein
MRTARCAENGRPVRLQTAVADTGGISGLVTDACFSRDCQRVGQRVQGEALSFGNLHSAAGRNLNAGVQNLKAACPSGSHFGVL